MKMAVSKREHEANAEVSTTRRKGVAVFLKCLSATCLASGSTNIISNATIKNWVRIGGDKDCKLRSRANKKLSTKHVIPTEYFCSRDNARLAEKITNAACASNAQPSEVIYSLALELVKQEGISGKANVKRLLEEYSKWVPNFVSWEVQCPRDEQDWLGAVYQCLLTEGVRNVDGVYYTCPTVVEDMLSHCTLNKDTLFLDPCCGSGAMFFSLKRLSPHNIFGIDKDPVAVFIAKLNLIRLFPDCEFDPQIYCCDYLHPSDSQCHLKVFSTLFDCIATNPPWGAVSGVPKECKEEIESGETFSLFYVKAYKQLKSDAAISFLLPESILNVRSHRDLRMFMLQHGSLKIITHYAGSFSGVTTKYIGVVAYNQVASSEIAHVFLGSSDQHTISRDTIFARENLEFTYVDEYDQFLLDKISAAGAYDLSQSDWALGIVTGDNKQKLLDEPAQGLEPIFTGKEVEPYRLKAPRKYIRYDRSNFQQVAKDCYYRVPEKLVYKFIADRPVFAYDDSGALFLNSANILIPNVKGMSVKTVLAVLNSDVLQFYYHQRFGGVKVLKSNLCALPLPQLTQEEERRISDISSLLIAGDYARYKELQYVIGHCYGVTSNEVDSISERINGKTK